MKTLIIAAILASIGTSSAEAEEVILNVFNIPISEAGIAGHPERIKEVYFRAMGLKSTADFKAFVSFYEKRMKNAELSRDAIFIDSEIICVLKHRWEHRPQIQNMQTLSALKDLSTAYADRLSQNKIQNFSREGGGSFNVVGFPETKEFLEKRNKIAAKNKEIAVQDAIDLVQPCFDPIQQEITKLALREKK